MALRKDSAVQENLGLESSTSRDSDEEPPLTQPNPRKRTRSVSANLETDVQDNLSMDLYDLLQA